jgi:hypothetical protein
MMTGESPNNKTQTFEVSISVKIGSFNPAKECLNDFVLSYDLFGAEIKQGDRKKGGFDP